MEKRIRLKDFTPEEQEIYYAVLLAHTVEDVLSKYICSDEQAYEAAEYIIDNLADDYYESYWNTVEETADECEFEPRLEDEVYSDEGEDINVPALCIYCKNCPDIIGDVHCDVKFCGPGGRMVGEDSEACEAYEEIDGDDRNIGG